MLKLIQGALLRPSQHPPTSGEQLLGPHVQSRASFARLAAPVCVKNHLCWALTNTRLKLVQGALLRAGQLPPTSGEQQLGPHVQSKPSSAQLVVQMKAALQARHKTNRRKTKEGRVSNIFAHRWSRRWAPYGLAFTRSSVLTHLARVCVKPSLLSTHRQCSAAHKGHC